MSFKPLLISFIFISACSTQAPQFEPLEDNPKSPRVTIYRPAQFANALVKPDVFHNNQLLCALGNNQHYTLELSKGKHLFTLELTERYTGQKQQTLNIHQTQDYFLRVSSKVQFQKNQPYTREFNIQQVSAEIALEEIANSKSLNKLTPQPTQQSESEDANAKQPAQFSTRKTLNPFAK